MLQEDNRNSSLSLSSPISLQLTRNTTQTMIIARRTILNDFIFIFIKTMDEKFIQLTCREKQSEKIKTWSFFKLPIFNVLSFLRYYN